MAPRLRPKAPRRRYGAGRGPRRVSAAAAGPAMAASIPSPRSATGTPPSLAYGLAWTARQPPAGPHASAPGRQWTAVRHAETAAPATAGAPMTAQRRLPGSPRQRLRQLPPAAAPDGPGVHAVLVGEEGVVVRPELLLVRRLDGRPCRPHRPCPEERIGWNTIRACPAATSCASKEGATVGAKVAQWRHWKSAYTSSVTGASGVPEDQTVLRACAAPRRRQLDGSAGAPMARAQRDRRCTASDREGEDREHAGQGELPAFRHPTAPGPALLPCSRLSLRSAPAGRAARPGAGRGRRAPG